MRFGIVRPIAKIKVQFFASQCISSDSYKQQQSYNTMYCIVHVIHVHCALFFTKYISWADPEGGQGSGLSLFTLIHMCIFPCSVRIIWDSVFVSVLEQQQSKFTWTNRMDWTAFNEWLFQGNFYVHKIVKILIFLVTTWVLSSWKRTKNPFSAGLRHGRR